MRLVALSREKRVTANAASLAFYAFDVVVALVVLSYALLTQFQDSGALAQTLHVLTGVTTSEFRRTVERAGGSAPGRGRAVALAVLISTWSSLRLFRAIEGVFSEIYDIRQERSLTRHLVDSLFVWVAVTLTVGVMGLVGSLFLFRTTGLLWTVLGPVVLWASLCLLFLPLYYTFSGGETAVSEVLPGTAVAASGWTVSAIALRLYVNVSSSVDLYGLVGALLLVLTWLYVVGLSIVLGVVLNAQLADRIEADTDWYLFDE
ncbi:YihY/virulence factor BrkB family protein [Haloarcula salina]|uniref:YihY/virulence factor BrkB family protein n=1 Tax=Haloarcula salina TaxID=1429914 RepID=A0AA41G1L7_9EURY|nr:YihY/virulence factor BrkB family protein [Haloarcula salina]MBV0901924.1 YihY/virulence factor BrkB family protein [Haloarcula salina]